MKKIFKSPFQRSLFIFFGIMSAVLLILAASPVSAAILRIDPPTDSTTFQELINKIINFVSLITIVLAPLMVIFAGFYFITANGDPSKVKKGKDILIYTAIGILVILLARGFVSMVINVL